jgi:hypothetical protein
VTHAQVLERRELVTDVLLPELVHIHDDLGLSGAALAQHDRVLTCTVGASLRPVDVDHLLGDLARGEHVGRCTGPCRVLDAQIEQGQQHRQLVGRAVAGLIEKREQTFGERDSTGVFAQGFTTHAFFSQA